MQRWCLRFVLGLALVAVAGCWLVPNDRNRTRYDIEAPATQPAP